MNNQDMSQIEETKAKFKPIPIIAAILFALTAIISFLQILEDGVHISILNILFALHLVSLLLISITLFARKRSVLSIIFLLTLSLYHLYNAILKIIIYSEMVSSYAKISRWADIPIGLACIMIIIVSYFAIIKPNDKATETVKKIWFLPGAFMAIQFFISLFDYSWHEPYYFLFLVPAFFLSAHWIAYPERYTKSANP